MKTTYEIIEKWVADNCECGVLKSGEWSEELFEEFGCDCRETRLGGGIDE